MRWFQALLPREDRFFGYFVEHAKLLLQGAEALRALLAGGEGVPESCAAIMRYEEAADEVTRNVMLAVRRTLITPFDRSDIRDLSTSLDDAIDQMQKTAKSITLFEVREFEPQMREMGGVILQAARLVLKALFLANRNGGAQGSPMRFIVGTELYDHLEKVVDRFEDVANEISALVID